MYKYHIIHHVQCAEGYFKIWGWGLKVFNFAPTIKTISAHPKLNIKQDIVSLSSGVDLVWRKSLLKLN